MKNNIRPAGNAPAKPLTEAEKQARIMQFLHQKRESFALNILCNLCKTLGDDATNAQAKSLVGLSVEMAEELIERLYPLPEETKDKEEKI